MDRILILGLAGVILISLGSVFETTFFGTICANLGAFLIIVCLVLFLIDYIRKKKHSNK